MNAAVDEWLWSRTRGRRVSDSNLAAPECHEEVALCTSSHYKTTQGPVATDHVILNHGQVTWTTPELAPPLLTTTPHQREDVSALDRFNVHLCPTRWVFSGTGLELVTRQDTIRYLHHSATAALEIVNRGRVIRTAPQLQPLLNSTRRQSKNIMCITTLTLWFSVELGLELLTRQLRVTSKILKRCFIQPCFD
ncbi:uncharacterized protein TNCV_4366551 [Trichonephila clavipes]|nr:uncharacterized protein TNCV_4366551 [Trichonephila clavipes]